MMPSACPVLSFRSEVTPGPSGFPAGRGRCCLDCSGVLFGQQVDILFKYIHMYLQMFRECIELVGWLKDLIVL